MELCSSRNTSFWGLLLRSLSTQLFFLVVVLLLVLSMTAFSLLLRSSTKLFVLSDCVVFNTALGIFRWGLPSSCLSLLTVLFSTVVGILRFWAFLFLPFVFCGHYSLSSCSMLFCSVLFRWVGLLSLFLVRPFHALFLGQLPPSSFLEQWGVVFWAVCTLRIRSRLRFLGAHVHVFSGSVLSNLQGCFHVLLSFFFRACSYAFFSL